MFVPCQKESIAVHDLHSKSAKLTNHMAYILNNELFKRDTLQRAVPVNGYATSRDAYIPPMIC